MGEKLNEPAAGGATGTQSGSASGTSTAGPGTGTGIGSGTGTGSATSGGGGGGSAATQERKRFDDGWTAASGTPAPGYEGMTPEEEIAELEEEITLHNRSGQEKYDYAKFDDAEEFWQRAGELRKRQNQLQRQLGLPESGPPKPSAGSSGAVEP